MPGLTRQRNLSPDGNWRSFSKVPNLLQYVNTGKFYGRVKVNGKLYRESLKTDVFSTAKLIVADFIKKKLRKKRQVGTPNTFAEARALYEQDLENEYTFITVHSVKTRKTNDAPKTRNVPIIFVLNFDGLDPASQSTKLRSDARVV
ncbi:MAG: hypothetical protein ACREDS_09815, partial [Limisphaerales bacterium]